MSLKKMLQISFALVMLCIVTAGCNVSSGGSSSGGSGSTIGGKIVSAEKNAVANVTVQIKGGNSTTSSAEGNWSIQSSEEFAWIQASRNGYHFYPEKGRALSGVKKINFFIATPTAAASEVSIPDFTYQKNDPTLTVNLYCQVGCTLVRVKLSSGEIVTQQISESKTQIPITQFDNEVLYLKAEKGSAVTYATHFFEVTSGVDFFNVNTGSIR